MGVSLYSTHTSKPLLNKFNNYSMKTVKFSGNHWEDLCTILLGNHIEKYGPHLTYKNRAIDSVPCGGLML